MFAFVKENYFIKNLEALKKIEANFRDIFNVDQLDPNKLVKHVSNWEFNLDKAGELEEPSISAFFKTDSELKYFKESLAKKFSEKSQEISEKTLEAFDPEKRFFFSNDHGMHRVIIPISTLKLLSEKNIKIDISDLEEKYIEKFEGNKTEIQKQLEEISGLKDSYFSENKNYVIQIPVMKLISSTDNSWDVFGKSNEGATKILSEKLEDFVNKHNLEKNIIKYETGSYSGRGETDWYNLVMDGRSSTGFNNLVKAIVENKKEFQNILKETFLALNPDQINAAMFSTDFCTREVFVNFNDKLLNKVKAGKETLTEIFNKEENLHHGHGKTASGKVLSVSRGYETVKDWLDKVIEVYKDEKMPTNRKALKGYLDLVADNFAVLEPYISEKIAEKQKYSDKDKKREDLLSPDGTAKNKQ